jgi:protein-S-isoprenylcysteine O-methyltransferase Ste14
VLFYHLGFYHGALVLVSVVAFVRVVVILALKFRQARYSGQAVAAPRTWRDVCTVPEPYLLGAMILWLLLAHDFSGQPSSAELGYGAVGLALAVAAAVLMVWSARSYPSVSIRHYVLPDHKVISAGPYALVRHPLYLAAFLVWFSLALAFSNVVVLLITLIYVIPSYLVYMRAEEEMLLRHLGDAYATYRSRVGMLFPRIKG